MSTTRNSSFELLRLILMLLIVIHHSIVHGLGLGILSPLHSDYQLLIPSNDMWFACIVNACCICSVDCFVLISGYFGINANLKKINYLILSIFIYTLFLTIIPLAIEGDWKEALLNCLFLSHTQYWFVVDYLFLMLFTPLLNLAFSKMSKINLDLFIISLLIISSYFGWLWSHAVNTDGYTLFQFVTMYSIGKRIRLFGLQLSKLKSIILYVICSIVAGLTMWYLWYMGLNSLSWRITRYNNPLIIASAIGLFMFFKHINIISAKINKLAKRSFGIYLFQSSLLIGWIQYGFIMDLAKKLDSSIILWLCIIIISLTVVFIALCLDSLRIKYLDKIVNIVCEKITSNTKIALFKNSMKHE